MFLLLLNLDSHLFIHPTNTEIFYVPGPVLGLENAVTQEWYGPRPPRTHILLQGGGKGGGGGARQ